MQWTSRGAFIRAWKFIYSRHRLHCCVTIARQVFWLARAKHFDRKLPSRAPINNRPIEAEDDANTAGHVDCGGREMFFISKHWPAPYMEPALLLGDALLTSSFNKPGGCNRLQITFSFGLNGAENFFWLGCFREFLRESQLVAWSICHMGSTKNR